MQCHDSTVHRCDCDLYKYLDGNYELLLGGMTLLLHRKVNDVHYCPFFLVASGHVKVRSRFMRFSIEALA